MKPHTRLAATIHFSTSTYSSSKRQTKVALDENDHICYCHCPCRHVKTLIASETTVYVCFDTSIVCQNTNMITFMTGMIVFCLLKKLSVMLCRVCCTSSSNDDYIKCSSLWQRCGRIWVLGLTDYFGQFLSPQWNTGEFSADSAESSTQDPLGFFAAGRVVSVRFEKGWRHGKSKWIIQKSHIKPGPEPLSGLRAAPIATLTIMSIYRSMYKAIHLKSFV